MEEKQLDFNRPLLSVRRFSPAVSTAEADNKRKTENGFPRVPPVYKSEMRSGPVRNPGTVPFVWEQSPGRPKYETKPQTLDVQHTPSAPRLPPGRTLNANRQQALDKVFEATSDTRSGVLGSQNAPSFEKNGTKEESFGDGIEETDVLGSEDDCEAYADALDTLSRSESFFLNCSVSGVSGLDGPDIKQWGTFSTDQQTWDFMMGRFLPAAKAMASETPQYSTRKLPVPQEQPRTTNKLLGMEKGDPFNEGRRLTNVQHGPHSNEEEETEEDGTRKQMQAPMLTSTMAKVRSSSSYVVCCPENANEHNKDDVHNQASIHVLQTKRMQDEWKIQSNKIPCRNHEKELDGSSLYKRLQGNAPLPCKEIFSKPATTEERRILGIPERFGVNAFCTNAKGGKLFREFLATESSEWESASSSPLAEKTLYIDSVHTLNPQISNSSSPDMGGIRKHRRDEVTKIGEVEETAFTYSSFQEDELVDKANMLSVSMESADFGLQSLSDKSMDDVKMVSVNPNHIQDPIDISTSEVSPKVVPFRIQSTKVGDNVDSNLDMKLSIQEEISNGSKSLLPLPPPLPKSPSESWLKRALPVVSSKHTTLRSSLGLNLQPRVQASKVDDSDSKWETIVKSAKVQHGHLRHSEELLSTIPEV